MSAPLRVLVSAVEPSADRLAAELVEALSRRLGNQRALEVGGLGGPLLGALGQRLAAGARWLPPAMGVAEVLGHLGGIRRNQHALVEAGSRGGWDVFVGVDAPDFHLPVGRRLRASGLPTVGLVSPQLWAWRPGRAAGVARAWDELWCLFDFEPALYAGTGLRARHLGHPALDRVPLSRREPGVLALFPGSRPGELRRHLGPFLEVARRLDAREVLVAEAPGTRLDPARLGGAAGVRVVPGPEALARAERALTKSGTVTLELALAGIPTVVAHRVHPLTWWIGRRLVRGVRHLALPNVLLGREAVPERLQHLDPAALAALLREAPPPPRDELLPHLGAPGVADRAAGWLLDAVVAR